MMDVDALTAHIRAQLHQDPTPAQIAAHFGVNRFALSRWFRAETGLSLRDYIAALKIEQGIAPLVQGQPVIASQLEAGHASAATFSHRFRAHTGQSPRDYRAQAATFSATLRQALHEQGEALVADRTQVTGQRGRGRCLWPGMGWAGIRPVVGAGVTAHW